jgi:hypothetical protein
VSGSDREKPFEVAVTADDTMQYDHIGGFDLLGGLGDIDEAAGNSFCHTALGQDACRFGLVVGRDLEVRHVSRSSPQQLDVEVTDAAPDLQNRRALKTLGCGEIHNALRRGGKPAAAVPP